MLISVGAMPRACAKPVCPIDDAPPTVRLTASFDGRASVLLAVQDSGHGIPLKDRERIFDPFFTTKSGGMGLGLAICSRLVANHAGTLRLVKTGSNGSTFEVAIPVGEHQSAE
jgi:signal transduction histidine kinase